MAAPSEAKQLETLLELQRDLALESNIDKVLLRITVAATFMLEADRATLYVVDAERNEIWSRALTEGGERGESVVGIHEIRLPLDGQSLAAEVARTGQLLRIDEPYADPRFDRSVDARSGYRTRSILVVPIDTRDRRRLGVLQAVNHRDGPFEADEERPRARELGGDRPGVRPALERPRGRASPGREGRRGGAPPPGARPP
jgi:GAF domain-containing protein